MFYSRSENSNGNKEELPLHLKKTECLASQFAKAFDEEIAGQWLGLFHDAGKASELFQDVLHHREHNVNHAAAGACLLYKMNSLIARVIYAHHDGLVWDIKDDLNCSFQISRSQDTQNGKRFAVSGQKEYMLLNQYMRNEIGIPKEYPVMIANESNSFYSTLFEMLHARVLLSCLADADYTASASHENEHVLEEVNGESLNSDKILENLENYRKNIISESTASSSVNSIREKVYSACLQAALQKPGIFTLTAPTGTGKTLALMAFAAAHAKQYQKRRVIIVLPYLSIISQNAKIYQEICGNVLEAHSMANYTEKTKQLSERWNAPVIITTSVKFFEVFFNSRPTDVRFLHNITNSVIVFDEAQSIPHNLVGTTMETMRMMCEKFKCTLLLSTATQPAFDIRKDIQFHPYEILPDSAIIYQKMKRVSVNWNLEFPLSWAAIAEQMSQQTSNCCVVNMKDHAHTLYQKLCELSDKSECFHISTDMCKAHREKILNEITKRLQKNLPCRLVSTSCIEAGVDLDFANMYRALAPLDAIIQCAGRCNRNGRNTGNMTVFIPDEKNLYPADTYENAANIIKLLNSRHPIDICDTSHIREYYEELYRQYGTDEPTLVKAIAEHDFQKVAQRYHFIPQSGANVLVPYTEKTELYETLIQEALEKGISKSWMKRAAPITVTSYYENKLDELCEKCFIHTKYGCEPVNGWYLLHDTRFYDEHTGLYFNNDSSLNTSI
ncbi:MAG: CRISPR-associated helicase Cas3' [Oscillospiraceae bacterium]|nr:CRISPR-associated helicase Cas3' [Oscillospiraceae bacterium]